MDSFHIITTTVAWLILLVSTIGNIILILALVKNFKTSSRGYICLMLNLAVADLLFVITNIPFSFLEQLKKPVFPFGALLCKLLWPFQTSVVVTAIFTVVVLSCQRYLMIVRTSVRFQKWSIPALVAILVVLWFSPIVAAAVPLAYSLELSNEQECYETWSDKHRMYFTVYLTSIQYILPLGIIAWCNGRAVLELKKHEIYREHFAIIDSTTLQRHKNVVRMLRCIVAVFAIFWFPGQLAWLVVTFSDGSDKWLILLEISQLFVFAHSAINPLIFFVYNDEYSMKGFVRLFKQKSVKRLLDRNLSSGRDAGINRDNEINAARESLRVDVCPGLTSSVVAVSI